MVVDDGAEDERGQDADDRAGQDGGDERDQQPPVGPGEGKNPPEDGAVDGLSGHEVGVPTHPVVKAVPVAPHLTERVGAAVALATLEVPGGGCSAAARTLDRTSDRRARYGGALGCGDYGVVGGVGDGCMG